MMPTLLLRILLRPAFWIVAAGLIALADVLMPSQLAVYVLTTGLLPVAWQTLHRRHVPLITSVLLVCVALPGAIRAADQAFGTRLLTVATGETAWGFEPARLWTLIAIAAASVFHLNLQRIRRRRLNLRRELQQRVRRRTDQVRRANQALRNEVTRRQETENLLDRSENRFKALMDRMQLQVTRKNPDGVFTYANETFCRTLGLTTADVIGRTDADLFIPELAKTYRADDQRVMKLAQPVDQVEEHPRLHGESGYVQVFKAPEYDQEGNCVGVQIIFWDITQKHRSEMALRDSEARKRALFEASGDAMLIVDADGKVVEANRSAAGLFHVAVHELVSRSIDEVAVPSLSDAAMVESTVRGLPEVDNHHDIAAPIRWAELPKASRHALRLRRADGTEFESETSVHMIPVGNGEGMAIIVRDVTLQRRAFETLQRAKAAAEEANRTKTEFMAGVSHELRTPLGGITGLAELLADSDLSPRDKQYTKLIQHSASLLSDVIEDILDFAAIEAGRVKITPTPIDLHATVSEAFECLTSRAREQSLRLVLSIDPHVPRQVVADAKRIRQIIINLAGNAIKFTPQGKVHLRLAVDPNPLQPSKSGHFPVVIAVSDTGIGIAREKQAKVFEAFERGEEGTTRVYGGTGLGLSISQKLAERMGGGIELESVLGEGSTFRCRIQVQQNLKAEPDSQRSAAGRLPHYDQAIINTGSVTMDAAIEETLRHYQVTERCQSGNAVAPVSHRQARRLLVLSEHHKPISREPFADGDAIVWIQQIGWPSPKYAKTGEPILIEPVSPDAILAAIAAPEKAHPPQAELAEQSEARLQTSLTRLPPTERTRVLLVDDSDVNRVVIHDMLARHGLQVDIAQNGRRALEWLAEDASRHSSSEAERASSKSHRAVSYARYACVLMDLQMPDMDGTEVAQRASAIYRHTGQAAPPIIALTAHVTEEHRKQCWDAGMVGFLTKPIAPEQLLAEIQKHVREAPPVDSIQPAASEQQPSRPTNAAAQDMLSEDSRWRERLMQHAGNQASIAVSLCDAFLTEVPSLIKRSRRTRASGDFKALKTSVHTIKSCLRYVADDADVALAAEVERRAGNQDEVTEEHLDEIEHVCKKWMKCVRQLHDEQRQQLEQKQ